MILSNQEIQVCWHPQTKNYYIEKGYNFTRMRDKFLVTAEDLSPKSHKKIKVICDYCGKIFEREKAAYTNSEVKGKDCCFECISIKRKETVKEKYGVDNLFQSEEIKKRSKDTCLKKYGTEYACQSEEVKDKIKKTNIEKYGYSVSLLNPEIKQKAINTCLECYGVENVFASEVIQEKIKKTHEERYGEGNIAHTPEISNKIMETNIKKYGVPFSTQAPEVIKKMRESLYKNGNVPSSKAEQAMCKELVELYGEDNCFPGYNIDLINLDCLLVIDNVKIDIEYVGWYWHKDRQEKDKRRNYFLIRNGYKVIRFIAENKVPSKDDLIFYINYLLKNEEDILWIYLDVDV